MTKIPRVRFVTSYMAEINYNGSCMAGQNPAISTFFLMAAFGQVK
jgi:hypothetical protein